jgi:hypothetical protein
LSVDCGPSVPGHAEALEGSGRCPRWLCAYRTLRFLSSFLCRSVHFFVLLVPRSSVARFTPLLEGWSEGIWRAGVVTSASVSFDLHALAKRLARPLHAK